MSVWDEVVKREPINRQTKRVTQRGDHYEFIVKDPREILSDMPIPTRPFPEFSLQEHNLTGKVFGRLTVIGLRLDGPNWVTRCQCGMYCTRKAKTLIKGLMSRGLMCQKCDNLERHKEGFGPLGLHRKSLNSASVRMYLAIKEMLKHGNTPAAIQMAVEAITAAETIPQVSE